MQRWLSKADAPAPAQQDDASPPDSAALRLSVASLTVMLVWLGAFPAPLMRVISMACASL